MHRLHVTSLLLTLLLLALPVCRDAHGGLPRPYVDQGLRPTTPGDADLVVVRERYSEADGRQSLYLRLAGRATTCHAALIVTGARIEQVTHGRAELLDGDARWGIAGGDYAEGAAGTSRGLEGRPETAQPTVQSPRDALRWTPGGTMVRFFLRTDTDSDIDDLRVLLSYPANPGNATFDLVLFQPGQEAGELVDVPWPAGELRGVRIGADTEDRVADDGEYPEEQTQINGVHLAVEDLDVQQTTLRFGYAEPGGRVPVLPLTIHNACCDEDPDGDGEPDLNGPFLPVPSTTDLENVRAVAGILSNAAGDLLPQSALRLLDPVPPQLALGGTVSVRTTLEIAAHQPSGTYRGELLLYEDDNDNQQLDVYEVWDRAWVTVTVLDSPGEGEGEAAEGEGEAAEGEGEAAEGEGEAAEGEGEAAEGEGEGEAAEGEGEGEPAEGEGEEDGGVPDGGWQWPGELRGGGGCGCDEAEAVSGGGAARAGWLLLLGLALVLTPRLIQRRARTAAPRASRRRGRRRRSPLLPLLLCAGVLAGGSRAEAQVDVSRLQLAPAPGDLLLLRGARALTAWQPFLALALDLADEPLVFADQGETVQPVVSRRLAGGLAGGLGLGHGLDAAVRLPGVLWQDAAPLRPGAPRPAGRALGDLALLLRWQAPLGGGMPTAGALAALLDLTLPTGGDRDQSGAGVATATPGLAGEWRVGPLRALALLGARLQSEVRTADLRLGPALTGGVGLAWRPRPAWELSAELLGETPLLHPGSGQAESPLDGVLGLRYRLPAGFALALGGGRGLTGGYGSPAWRAVASLGWGVPPADAPPPVEERPLVGGPDVPAPPRPGDRDGDGIPDPDDDAPWHPEDRDEYSDLDGVPDPDDDLDGLLDGDDPQPRVPAPTKIALAPPTAGAAADAVVATEEEIRIPDTLLFHFGQAAYTRESASVLDEVVDVIQRNPQIQRVHISGHADSVGSAAYNLVLSRRRATVVRDYLVRRGIAPERIDISGHGAERPAYPNLLSETRARNRRVEFILVETEAGTSEQVRTPEESAVLVSASGRVLRDGQPVVAGTPVAVGTLLMTDAGGRALLRFPDLSLLEIGPASEVRVGKAYWDPRHRQAFLSAKVHAGSARWRTSAQAEGKSRTSLYTQGAAANFDEADVRVLVLDKGVTQVEVYHGVARVSSGGAGTDLVEGNGLRLAPQLPPDEPHPLPGRPQQLRAARPALDAAPRLTWEAGAATATSWLEFAADPAFVQLLQRVTTGPGASSSELPPGLPGDAVWRVCPEAADGYRGRCSAVWPVDEATVGDAASRAVTTRGRVSDGATEDASAQEGPGGVGASPAAALPSPTPVTATTAAGEAEDPDLLVEP